MTILYVGDIMGEMGIATVALLLPGLKRAYGIDLVIAQSENVSEGKGITPADFKRLRNLGVDACSGGNWSLERKEIIPQLSDPTVPIIRPANYPTGTPGLGYKYVDTRRGPVLCISLVGHIVGRDAEREIDNPLQVIDDILQRETSQNRVATVVNFHGDYSSEKVVIGHYLDGRATAVIGDHWHVPTADARVLPGGTAHMTDVGMCGALDASLGVTFDSVIPRWRDGTKTRNRLATTGRRQFNALLIRTAEGGLAASAEHIQRYLD
ncbi:MAG TPA: TIGR00282 family metallophosphoesterase [Candidatus Saccharimonadales bacterium]|nr:TIGR00282 family metallophosphoesterase [Candidatus Saccharimonadales bacterium]